MGGRRSGRSGWRISTTAASSVALGIGTLSRAGGLQVGKRWEFTIADSEAEYQVVGTTTEGGVLLQLQGRPWMALRIARQPCYLGGSRPFWICPRCSRNCARVYLMRGGGCRRCFNLAYPSQSETAGDRALRQLRKTNRRLQCPDWEDPHAWPRRPKGMHRTTFRRLELRAFAAYKRWQAGWLAGAQAFLARVEARRKVRS